MLVDAQGYNPGWMSADRRTIYGDRTTTLCVAVDPGEPGGGTATCVFTEIANE
jgi:hypothetical protein